MSRVLFFAEDPTTAAILTTRFEQAGHTVTPSQDSIEVLSLLDREAPQVIVVHAPVPSGLGLEALHTLSGRRSTDQSIPLILVSADATLLLDGDARSPHVLSQQPVELDELLHHVARLGR